jgi:hypothetical protein
MPVNPSGTYCAMSQPSTKTASCSPDPNSLATRSAILALRFRSMLSGTRPA